MRHFRARAWLFVRDHIIAGYFFCDAIARPSYRLRLSIDREAKQWPCFTTEDVLNKKFQYVMRIRPDEVDEFLTRCSHHLPLQMKNQELKEKLRRAASLSALQRRFLSSTPAPAWLSRRLPRADLHRAAVDPESAMLALAQRVHDEYAARWRGEQSAKDYRRGQGRARVADTKAEGQRLAGFDRSVSCSRTRSTAQYLRVRAFFGANCSSSTRSARNQPIAYLLLWRRCTTAPPPVL